MTITSRVITSRTKTIACPPGYRCGASRLSRSAAVVGRVGSVHIAPESSERVLPGRGEEIGFDAFEHDGYENGPVRLWLHDAEPQRERDCQDDSDAREGDASSGDGRAGSQGNDEARHEDEVTARN